MSSSQLAQSDRQEQPAPPPGPSGRRGMFVLAVDDNPDALDIIKKAFEHASRVQVFTAQSAESALKLAGVMVPDVVISDLSMPGRDGYWLIRQLRVLWGSHPRTIPAIAITAYRETHDRDKALRAGFNEYIEKPVDPFTLFALITRLLPPFDHDDSA